MKEGVTRRTSLAALAAGPAIGASALPQAPFVHSRSALERLRDFGASVKDTGAVGDGIADDTAAIQEMASYFGKRGGTWRIPGGIYRTTAPIEIDCRTPQIIVGNGGRAVYPGVFDPRVATDATVILPMHSGRQAIGFKGYSQGNGSMEIQNVALASLERGPIPVAAFGWDVGLHFLRDFRFIGCSVHGFTSAFDVYRTVGSESQAGLFRAHYCRINRNAWIVRTLDGTQWNGFDFSFNEAGQNGYNLGSGGIGISAHGVSIVGNCLEGMRDPIRITGGFQAIDIRSNYFEANVGRALIWLDRVEGAFDIGPNTLLALDAGKLDHIVLLTHCGRGRSALHYRPDVTHKLDPAIGRNQPAWGNASGSTRDGFLRCDSLDAGGFLGPPNSLATDRPGTVGTATDVHPVTGGTIHLEKFTTGRSDRVSMTSAIRGNPGEWLVFSILSKFQPKGSVTSDPYVSFNVNGNGTKGSRDYVVYGFKDWWRPGEWSVMTGAIKLQTSINRVLVDLYPFGINPITGGDFLFLRPFIYTVRSPADVKPYVAID